MEIAEILCLIFASFSGLLLMFIVFKHIQEVNKIDTSNSLVIVDVEAELAYVRYSHETAIMNYDMIKREYERLITEVKERCNYLNEKLTGRFKLIGNTYNQYDGDWYKKPISKTPELILSVEKVQTKEEKLSKEECREGLGEYTKYECRRYVDLSLKDLKLLIRASSEIAEACSDEEAKLYSIREEFSTFKSKYSN